MCNTPHTDNPTLAKRNNKNTDNHDNDYRFLDYRLTQLENQIEKGFDNVEQEQRKYNIEVMRTLQELQEGQNRTTESMARVRQRLDDMDTEIRHIDTLKEAANKNTESIHSAHHRIDVVQKILFAVAGAALSALFTAAFSVLQLIMLK